MKLSPGQLDIFLLLPLGASLMMISEAPEAKTSATLNLTEWGQVAILGALALVLAFLVIKATAIDRRCQEEYVFQILANAALVGLGTMVLVNMLWLIAILFMNAPEMTGNSMVGVGVFAWIASYYWYRWRGFER